MLLKVTVNKPKDPTELYEKFNETLSEILINKLQPEEVDQLIDLLKKDKITF
ncbi:hypothetical protein [Clostridium pasteurianum]|uniref:Uncharacterized protein n=1 Tax=Clostridium pasteurianum BC1 TaxID=86416 RepID=R4JYK5_CLOPA|nr:hypothetical protein [Clostridium pasteurianum]AGK95378.1 hypothetical protein Clopa_0316 [Clostridium pasteurianum BC1]